MNTRGFEWLGAVLMLCACASAEVRDRAASTAYVSNLIGQAASASDAIRILRERGFACHAGSAIRPSDPTKTECMEKRNLFPQLATCNLRVLIDTTIEVPLRYEVIPEFCASL